MFVAPGERAAQRLRPQHRRVGQVGEPLHEIARPVADLCERAGARQQQHAGGGGGRIAQLVARGVLEPLGVRASRRVAQAGQFGFTGEAPQVVVVRVARVGTEPGLELLQPGWLALRRRGDRQRQTDRDRAVGVGGQRHGEARALYVACAVEHEQHAVRMRTDREDDLNDAAGAVAGDRSYPRRVVERAAVRERMQAYIAVMPDHRRVLVSEAAA